MVKRLPIPKTQFPEDVMKRLYNRYHGLANKARMKEIKFAWGSFTEFYDDLIKVAPDNYDPDIFRMRFDLGMGVGYAPESMVVTPTGVSSKYQKAKMAARMEERVADFVTDLSILFLTEEGSVQDLINQAYSSAISAG